MSVIAGRYSAWTTVRVRRWPRHFRRQQLAEVDLRFVRVRRVRLVLDDVKRSCASTARMS